MHILACDVGRTKTRDETYLGCMFAVLHVSTWK